MENENAENIEEYLQYLHDLANRLHNGLYKLESLYVTEKSVQAADCGRDYQGYNQHA